MSSHLVTKFHRAAPVGVDLCEMEGDVSVELVHARKYFLPYSDIFLPIWSLWAVGVVIPFVELLAGALLIRAARVRAPSFD
jgi:hypothetical protein